MALLTRENGRLARVIGFFALVACVLATVATLDVLNQPPRPEVKVAHDDPLLPRGQVFVFLIDSLRYETATDAALMPALVALRGESTFARVKPTRDAVTVPCIRAAMTGEEGTRILAFVTNFLKRSAGTESVFTDLAARGRRGAALSDGAFVQFGTTGHDDFSNGEDGPTEVHDQNAAADHALELYRSGDYDLTVMHITYTDHIAHKAGVGAAPYIERFAEADRLVAKLAAATRPEDTFVVMGDHGHDRAGRHTFGLDVPTFALYRGPRFRPAHDLGTIAIRDHRYLLGWALGLPLPPAYGGGLHPDALVSLGPIPTEYAAATDTSVMSSPKSALHRPRQGAYLATIGALCVTLAAWMLVFLPRRGEASARHVVFVGGLSLLAGVVFAALGGAFPLVRPWFHEPAFSTIAEAWAGLWLVAFGIARWKRDAALCWPLLTLPLFVLFPTVYRYGAAPALGPAWMGFAISATVAKTSAPGAPAASGATMATWLRSPLVPVLVLTLAVLFPFSGAEASDFRFETWVFYPVAIGEGARVWVALALLAKFILFIRPGLPPWAHLAGGAAILLLVTAEVGHVSTTAELVVGVVLLVAAWRSRFAAQSSPTTDTVRHAGRVASIAGCLLLFRGLTQMLDQTYLWLDCFLAALLGSGRLVALAVPPQSRRLAYALLLLFAWIGTGWISFAWTVHRLEWHFLYDWFDAPFVEQHVWLFLPLILARYLLPLLVARSLLAESLGPPEPEVRRFVFTLASAKVLTLLLFTAGIGWANSESDVYLEAAQETGIGTVLTAGLP